MSVSLNKNGEPIIKQPDVSGQMNEIVRVSGDTMTEKENKALELIEECGFIGGNHHKAWLLDQIARVLTGDNYKEWVNKQKDGEDGPNTFNYDEGRAP